MPHAPSRRWIPLLVVLFLGCSSHGSSRESAPARATHVVPEQHTAAQAAAGNARRTDARQADGPHASGDVLVYQDGRAEARITPGEADARGLIVVDLSDGWLLFVFSEQPELGHAGAQPYAATYRALADERFDDAPNAQRAEQDHWLELY